MQNDLQKYNISPGASNAAQIIGYGVEGMISHAVGALVGTGSYTLFQTSFINSMNEAINEGADEDEAVYYGALNGFKAVAIVSFQKNIQ